MICAKATRRVPRKQQATKLKKELCIGLRSGEELIVRMSFLMELYVVMQKRFIKEKFARESIQLLHDPATDRNTVRFQLDVKEFHKILQAG